MKKTNVFSVLMVCLLVFGSLFTAALYAQDSEDDNAGYAMVLVPGGSFQMGAASGGNSDQRPVRTVTLSAFSIGKYEVTQALYQSVMGYNPSHFNRHDDSPRRPVEQVTWYDAVEFCNKLSEREGLQPVYAISGRTPAEGYPIASATVTADWSKNGYCLPTEAQWEYAAKGGHDSPGNHAYSGSDDVNDVAWHSGNSDGTHHVVGIKGPNGLGIYDMSGNVFEWCWDWYGTYPAEAQTDPVGASSGSFRVLRGGGGGYSAERSRSASRGYDFPNFRNGHLGFRVVMGVSTPRP